MDRFNIPQVAEGLTAYAVEWQNGFQRSAVPTYAPTWTETRRLWTDSILQGMAELDGQEPDPSLMEQYDRQLEQAKYSFASIPASQRIQKETIRGLRDFVRALGEAEGDHRRQITLVKDLMEDMAIHRPWNYSSNQIDTIREEAERSLVRLTAQTPIRFSRVLLGWETGPLIGGFVSGAVQDAEAVRGTALYDEASRLYPEVSEWPAVCATYVGGDPVALFAAPDAVDAAEFDLDIMNRTGDRYLIQPGVRHLSGPYELTVSPGPVMTMQ